MTHAVGSFVSIVENENARERTALEGIRHLPGLPEKYNTPWTKGKTLSALGEWRNSRSSQKSLIRLTCRAYMG